MFVPLQILQSHDLDPQKHRLWRGLLDSSNGYRGDLAELGCPTNALLTIEHQQNLRLRGCRFWPMPIPMYPMKMRLQTIHQLLLLFRGLKRETRECHQPSNQKTMVASARICCRWNLWKHSDAKQLWSTLFCKIHHARIASIRCHLKASELDIWRNHVKAELNSELMNHTGHHWAKWHVHSQETSTTPSIHRFKKIRDWHPLTWIQSCKTQHESIIFPNLHGPFQKTMLCFFPG